MYLSSDYKWQEIYEMHINRFAVIAASLAIMYTLVYR